MQRYLYPAYIYTHLKKQTNITMVWILHVFIYVYVCRQWPVIQAGSRCGATNRRGFPGLMASIHWCSSRDVLLPLVGWLIEGFERNPLNNMSMMIDGINQTPAPSIYQKDIIIGDVSICSNTSKVLYTNNIKCISNESNIYYNVYVFVISITHSYIMLLYIYIYTFTSFRT